MFIYQCIDKESVDMICIWLREKDGNDICLISAANRVPSPSIVSQLAETDCRNPWLSLRLALCKI